MARILIVDDSKMTRDFHAYVLRASRYEVVEAIDGADAIEKLYRHPDIKCIVTDINMPNMDGLTMLKKIRSTPELAHIPVVVVTTIDRPEEQMEALKAGANFYLIKPVKPSILVASIRMVVRDGDRV
ncbi:chemotaxis protein CheY [Pseudothermotoga hypogea DSM 11164 = NBRC 106472]|uniref:Chemotaxis protein CheY n=1 Tax=Pseudothermotoga hypogea DSM 11164 = NBRC 106472 TaxID=1123384 RepID=A0A0X1KS76_9THEM|nr:MULTISPECIES: response regulator [Pseudothermotoga]AJC74079.1 chemotaxis protein CheY [Pseudothermotoga hypogea DSM 11164 = NBRC 106472]MBC7123249.1 response regulator [Pseudothermotoga sp.]MDI6861876.1 response regulator [Pseudothermotoga sp.]MDK2923410.1 two-component system, chemotaxis family, chemotaxis protein CheY [Pseudothermotoga sp.]